MGEGLGGGGGTIASCQLKFWPFVRLTCHSVNKIFQCWH